MAVVGVNIFKKNCCVKNFSEYISVSDEAMTMLILANNWDVWSEIARHEIATNPKNLPDIKRKKVEQCVSTQRFHIDGKGRGFSWSPEGKLYYNMCYQQVRNDRELNGKRFDEYFIGEMRTTEEANKRNISAKAIVAVASSPCIWDQAMIWIGPSPHFTSWMGLPSSVLPSSRTSN
mgnify:CR=1 FL=1